MRKLKYEKDNLLGWPEEDFMMIKSEIVNCRHHHGLFIPVSMLAPFCGYPDSIKFPILLKNSATEISATLQGDSTDGSGKVCANTRLQIFKWG